MNKPKGRRHSRKKEYYKKFRAGYELKKAARAVKRKRRIEAAVERPTPSDLRRKTARAAGFVSAINRRSRIRDKAFEL